MENEKLCSTCAYETLCTNEFPCKACDNYSHWTPPKLSINMVKSVDESRAKGITIEAKADAGKPKLSLVPRQIIYDIARIREYGNNKYPEGGPDNWKKVEIERYRDAAFRHFLAYLDDPKGADKESGLPHLAHLACNIAFLCELEKGETNDRAVS